MYKKLPFWSEIFLQLGWVLPVSAFPPLPTVKEPASLVTATLHARGLSCPTLHYLPKTCLYSLWDVPSWA